MNKTLNFKTVSGVYEAYSSKSYGHRAIIASSLSKGISKLINIDLSEDILVTIDAFKNLGVNFMYENEKRVLNIDSRSIGKIKNETLDMKDSGTSLRFIVPILMLFNKKFLVEGSETLMERPMNSYFEIFDKVNFTIKKDKSGNKVYLVNGPIKPGNYRVSGDKSSQFISGLLFVLPLLKEDSTIIIKNKLESKSYIDMTLSILEDYGIKFNYKEKDQIKIYGNQSYKNRNYRIEGDYSQASFFLAAGALGGNLIIKGLNKDSAQGDREIIKILKNMGCIIIEEKEFIKIYKNENIRPLNIDISNIPDLAPIIAVLLSFSTGCGSIYNIKRLEFKESNRIESIINLINSIGGSAFKKENSIVIQGFKSLEGGVVETYKDHRIIMASSVAALRCTDKIIIKDYEYVNKSYPKFYEDLKEIVLDK